VDLYPLDAEVNRLEAAAQAGEAASRAEVFTALCWALRQRDSNRALKLGDDADRMAADGSSERKHATVLRTDLVRSEVAALRGEHDRAETTLARALRIAASLGDPIGAGDAAMAEAVVAHAQAQRDRYMSAWHRAADHYSSAGDPLRAALARGWIAFVGAHSDRERSAVQAAALRSEFVAPRHPALEALLHAVDGVLGYTIDVATCSASAYQASLYARECGLVRHAIVSSMNAGTAMQSLADFDGAAQSYDWAAVEARKTGWTPLIGSSLMRQASLHRELGQLEAAEQGYREALAALAVSPGGIIKAEANAGLGHTLLRLGRANEAIPILRTATELFRGESSVDGHTVNLLMLARALAQCGHVTEARAVLDEATEAILRWKLVRLKVDLHEARAELQECGAIPPPEGASPQLATARSLEDSLAAGADIEGWHPSSRLLMRVSRAWAAAGDAQRSFKHAEQAIHTLQQENLKRATNAAAVMRARNELERERAEHEHQRSLIAALEQASLTDPLTGLRNRRFLQEHLGLDVAQALRRYGGGSDAPIAEADLLFFLVDIDHFKQVNDARGHAAGDAVLVQMRERLASVFRETDYLVRWGGEEFLVVARASSRSAAADLAERLRAAVASRPFVLDDGQPLTKTCSIGYAALPFFTGDPSAVPWEEVVDIADTGLYMAKRNGRNAWVGLAPGEGGDRKCESSIEALRTPP